MVFTKLLRMEHEIRVLNNKKQMAKICGYFYCHYTFGIRSLRSLLFIQFFYIPEGPRKVLYENLIFISM